MDEEHHLINEEKVLEEGENHISRLPDSVLSAILSSLKIREAARTSMISTRWRYLWTSSLKNLIFDAGNILDEQDYSVKNINDIVGMQSVIILWKRKIAFINSVQQLLLQLQLNDDIPYHKIEKLKVYFTFTSDKYSKHLDHWICFATSRNVEEVDLCLRENHPFGAPINHSSLYDFPCNLLEGKSSFKCLRLAYCVLAPNVLNSIGFTTLKTLDLNRVDLKSQDHVKILLSNCHSLEWLSLSKCSNLCHLRVEHPMCQTLKYLSVNGCDDLKGIKLDSIKLETLEYKGYMVNFVFNDVPNLRTIFSEICDWRENVVWPLSRLPVDLPQLETLYLSCNSYFEAGLMPKRLPKFHNLKHLVILEVAKFYRDLLWIAAVVEASPMLQKLELHLSIYDCYYEEERTKKLEPHKFPHNHLKEVLITGTCGYFNEIAIAAYLLNNATALGKMIIDPRPRIYLGTGKWNNAEASPRWFITGRNRVMNHLSEQIRAPVELLIL